jgi:hypothetical protein
MPFSIWIHFSNTFKLVVPFEISEVRLIVVVELGACSDTVIVVTVVIKLL